MKNIILIIMALCLFSCNRMSNCAAYRGSQKPPKPQSGVEFRGYKKLAHHQNTISTKPLKPIRTYADKY